MKTNDQTTDNLMDLLKAPSYKDKKIRAMVFIPFAAISKGNKKKSLGFYQLTTYPPGFYTSTSEGVIIEAANLPYFSEWNK